MWGGSSIINKILFRHSVIGSRDVTCQEIALSGVVELTEVLHHQLATIFAPHSVSGSHDVTGDSYANKPQHQQEQGCGSGST